MEIMAEEYDNLYTDAEPLLVLNAMRQLWDPSELPSGPRLNALTEAPSWSGIIDLFSARPYFLRLWVVQEVMLSSQATIVCGRHRTSWDVFSNAARLLWHCEFLQKNILDYTILAKIFTIADRKIQFESGELKPTLFLADFILFCP